MFVIVRPQQCLFLLDKNHDCSLFRKLEARRSSVGVLHATSPVVFGDIPKSLFAKPEDIFQLRPQKLFDNITMRDLINAREEVLRDFPFELAIIAAVVALLFWDFSSMGSGGSEPPRKDAGRDSEGEDVDITQIKEVEKLKSIEKFDDNNRALGWLAGVTAIAVWMAGFLNGSTLSP